MEPIHGGGAVTKFQNYDDFEEELLEVRTLIEATVAKHRERRSRNSLVVKLDPSGNAVVAAAARLIGQTTRCVDLVLATDQEISRSAYGALDRLVQDGGTDISVRLVCTYATLDQGFVARHATAHRVDVRVSRVSSLAAVIVDSRIALVCANSAVYQRASVVQAPTVIPALRALFDNVWRHASDTSEPVDFGDRARTETVLQVLECLRAGVTDEAAARMLSVSVRTYRRYVAEILAQLGADSRFQAGVRAAELGLLPPAR